MKLAILDVFDPGVLDKERIKLQALDNIEIGNYCLADSTYTDDGKVSNKLRHFLWIPDKKVAKGDYIVIYTKAGQSKDEKNNQTTTHTFFWGLKETVWNKSGDVAILLHIDEWAHKKVK